jgi:hypothetical protein
MDSQTGLRVPRCWNDRYLLGDEPFKGSFLTRSVCSEGRGRKSGMKWDEHIAEQVKKTLGGVSIQTFAYMLRLS